MPLSFKTKISILIIVIIAPALSMGINEIFKLFPNTFIDTSPIFFEEDRYARFYYDNGTYGIQQPQELVIINDLVNSSYTNITLTINGKFIGQYWTHPNGTVYQFGKCQNNYSIWGLNTALFKYRGLSIVGGEGIVFSIIDPIGFLGPEGRNYTAVLTKSVMYFPDGIKYKGLLGAHASFEVEIFNNVSRIGTGVYDGTSGMLFSWSGGVEGQKLFLYETDFIISQNRLFSISIKLSSAIVLIVITYIFIRKKWKNKFLSKLYLPQRERIITMAYLILGNIGLLIEVIDIWYYCLFGYIGCMLFHLFYILSLGITIYLLKKSPISLAAAGTEFAFIYFMTLYVGHWYYGLVISTGVFMSYIWVLFSKSWRRISKNESKLRI
ncbi:MAG: hypothetical protein GF317_06045 [Candidatus Lokiarchaeota archaeon]|nr:hypothetical protein [Candidatus Lokiarchaeota archaeon]